MMYRNLIAVLALGLAGNLYAAQQDTTGNESDDDRVACIEEAIAEEVEEGEQYDSFIETCTQEKAKQRAATGQ